MEKKDNSDFIIEDIRDLRYKLHQEEIENKKKYIQNHTNELNPNDEIKQRIKEFNTDIKNRKNNLRRIDAFKKIRQFRK